MISLNCSYSANMFKQPQLSNSAHFGNSFSGFRTLRLCGGSSSRIQLKASALPNEGSDTPSFKKVLLLKPSITGYTVSVEQNELTFKLEIAGKDMIASENSRLLAGLCEKCPVLTGDNSGLSTDLCKNCPILVAELPTPKASQKNFIEWGKDQVYQLSEKNNWFVEEVLKESCLKDIEKLFEMIDWEKLLLMLPFYQPNDPVSIGVKFCVPVVFFVLKYNFLSSMRGAEKKKE